MFKKQISIVKSCQLKRLGNLPMEFVKGGCNTFKNLLEKKKHCSVSQRVINFPVTGNWKYVKGVVQLNLSYDGDKTTKAPPSNHQHFSSSIGRLNNTLVVVGSREGRHRKKMEAFQVERWNVLATFPFVDKYIHSYSMVTFKDVLYLFGN